MNKNKSIGELYYIHTIIISVFLFIFYTFGINTSFLHSSILNYKTIKSDIFDGTVYPIEFIPDPFLLTLEERKKPFSEIDSAYFIKIPIYDPNIFGINPEELSPKDKNYINVLNQRVTYTIPYMSTYNFDFKEYSGSHPGVDIIVPENTPVKSIANGVIVKTGNESSGFGKYILIRHDNVPLPDGTNGNIYSLYAHLNEISVKEGIKIKKGNLIGLTGKTGTATTWHLHFQIDLETAPYSPYWPFTSKDMKDAQVNFFEGVNIGLGKENAITYTINPLKFVNTNLNSFITTFQSNGEEKKEEEKKDVKIIELNSANEENIIQEDIIIEKNDVVIQKEDIINKNIELLTINDDFVLNDNSQIFFLSNNIENKEETISTQEQINTDFTLKELFENLDEEVENDVGVDLVSTQEEEIKGEEKIFFDIDSDYKYINELIYFKNKNIISGFDDNNFRPNNNITRAESLKMILLGLEKEVFLGQISQFNDIKTDSWENNYINTGVELGIITTQNKNFYPNRNISRVEGLKIILNLSKTSLENLNLEFDLNDVENTSWYYNYVLYAINNNLIQLENGNFYPNKPLTREELIYILYKFSIN